MFWSEGFTLEVIKEKILILELNIKRAVNEFEDMCCEQPMSTFTAGKVYEKLIELKIVREQLIKLLRTDHK